MQNVLRSRGVDPAPGTPAELAAFIQSETVKLKKVIDLAGIKPE
jgi:tripartite-type tricarboxylate transporter receptor subunit TctC